MEEYYERMNELVLDLLLPARAEKSLNKEAYEKFYSILIELKNKMKGEEYIPRKIAGLLFFISDSLSDEANYCNYQDELFMAAGRVNEIVGEILWDSPLKN